MRRLKTASTIVLLTAIAALFLTSLVWSAQDESGSILAAARSVVRPNIKRVGPVRVTGQIKKGLSRADLDKLKIPPEDSGEIRIPKPRVHTIKETTSVVRKLKGGQVLLKSVPVPTSGELPDNASLLLTPLKPRGYLSGVRSRIWLYGVTMSYNDTSLARSASQDRVCMRSEEYGGAVRVCLTGMRPGWYVVAADFVARRGGPHGLRSIWAHAGEGTGGQFEISSTLKARDELFLPVMFQVTNSNSSANVNFYPSGQHIWFRSVSVQRLN